MCCINDHTKDKVATKKKRKRIEGKILINSRGYMTHFKI